MECRAKVPRVPPMVIRVVAILVMLGPFSVSLFAQTPPEPLNFGAAFTLFQGQGADVNLPDIPKTALRGDLIWENAHFIGVHYQRLLYPIPGFRLIPFPYVIKGLRLELEGQATRHWGLQHNGEVHVALALRTQDFNPFLNLGFNLAYADGISHALSTPTYEDGPGGGRTGARYATQHYIGIELALGWLTHPAWQVIGRIHHRSGIWGIFAPQGVGSNFFTLGLRWRY